MVSILDQIDIVEETSTSITYLDEDTLIIEDLSESPLTLDESPAEPIDTSDPENPGLVAFRSLLFDTIYHQLDTREWVV